MTTRRALLIAVAQVPGENPVPGTYRDAVRMARYLQSVAGGAWDLSTEIRILNDPDRPTVIRAMEWAHGADVSIVLFSGHGYERVHVSSGRAVAETRMICGDRLELSRDDLTPWISRSIVLLDCCRRPEVAKSLGESRLGGLIKASIRRISLQQARQLYDRALRDSAIGTLYVHGCDFNQEANDTYSFTRALLEECESWSESANVSEGVQSFLRSFQSAIPALASMVPGQRPKLEFTTPPRSFPFAVPSRLS